MARSKIRDAYLAMITEQARGCRFPSPPMLDRIDAAITDREDAEDYVLTLIEKLREERFPSPTMIDRLSSLVDLLDLADLSVA
jgi:hypothetical protein